MTTSAISSRNLTKAYGPVTAVRGVTFDVERGQVAALLGDNGAGKSTVIGLMLNLVRGRGQTHFLGRRLDEHEHPANVVGAVTDSRPVYPWWTGRQHLHAFGALSGSGRDVADELLEATNLTDAADRRVKDYSLGMRQRLSLAMALIGRPDVLVLDEPMIGLDPSGLRWLGETLRHFAAAGGTVLVSSHHLADLEGVVDRVVVLQHGRLVADEDTESFVGRHAPQVVRARTADPGVLVSMLREAGALIVNQDGDVVRFQGVRPEEVARRALDRRVLLYELTTEHGGLHEAFFTVSTASEPAAQPGPVR